MAAGTKGTSIDDAPGRAFDRPERRIPAWLRADPRTAILLAALIMLAIAAAALIQMRRDREVALKAAELRITDLAWNGANALRTALQGAERILSLAVSSTRVAAANPDAALETLTRLEPLIVNIVLLGPDGMLRASRVGRADYPQFFTNQPFYETFMREGDKLDRLVGPFADPKLGATPVALFVRIDEADGRFGGLAIALLDSQELARRISAYSADVSLAVVDSQGRMAAGMRHGAPIAPDSLGLPLAFSVAASADGAPGVKYVHTGEPDAPTRAIVGTAFAPGYGVSVAVTQPADMPLEPWFGSIWLFAMLIAGPVAIGSILAAALTNKAQEARLTREALRRSERRYAAAVSGARAGVAEIDPADEAITILPSLADLTGGAIMPGSHSLGEFSMRLHPADSASFRAAVEAARRGQRAAGLALRLPFLGGGWTWARFTLQPGSGSMLLGVATDISEERSAEALRTTAEARLRETIENAPQGVVLWDGDGRLVTANRRYRDFTGLKGRHAEAGADRMAALASLTREGEETGAEGYPPHWQVRRLNVQPEEGRDELWLIDGRWLHASHRPTSDGGELGVLTDITPLKNQEAELLRREIDLREAIAGHERAQEQLERQTVELTQLTARLESEKHRAEEGYRAKSEFLANMSHQLRTPLNAIIGFSELMGSELFGPLGHPKYVEYARDVISSAQGLLELITDILDMSKIESGEIELEPTPTEIGPAIMEAVRLIAPRAEEKGVKLLLDLGEEVAAFADARALKRVLLNLLSNAVKFTERGGAARVRARSHGGFATISVEDTGCGIDPADIPRLGKPFVQLNRPENATSPGTGLGLAVAKALVDLGGGGLSIESASGRGTIVRFTIPAEAFSPA